MTFCTVESLTAGFDINDIACKFISWYKNGYWGAHDELFDIGGATRSSLDRIIKGESPFYSGALFAEDNGNGALMRILPIAFILKSETDIEKRYQKIKQLAAITHAHFRSGFSCFLFVEFILALLKFHDKKRAYVEMQKNVTEFAAFKEFNTEEIDLFNRLLRNYIADLPENQIKSSGYVLDSLESAIWCFMTTDSYKEATLKAVNLGGDIDTTGAITGGLAGFYYGLEQIPDKWLEGIAKKTEINELSDKFIQTIVER